MLIYVSSVLILLSASGACANEPLCAIGPCARPGKRNPLRRVYAYISVYMSTYMCPHTSIYPPSAYYYISTVRIPL